MSISHNVRQLGEVADGVRRSPNYHKASCGAKDFKDYTSTDISLSCLLCDVYPDVDSVSFFGH